MGYLRQPTYKWKNKYFRKNKVKAGICSKHTQIDRMPLKKGKSIFQCNTTQSYFNIATVLTIASSVT